AESRRLAGPRESQRDHAGDDEDPYGEELQVRGEDRPAASLPLVRGAEGPLHDVLVRGPIPQADDRRAEEHAEPRVVPVEVPGNARRLLDWGPGAVDARRDERLPEIEHVRRQRGAELVPAAEPDQTKHGDEDGADDEDDRLYGLGVRHAAHPAGDGVQPGEHDDRHRADPKTVEGRAPEVQPYIG